jgi:hypothetical protein
MPFSDSKLLLVSRIDVDGSQRRGADKKHTNNQRKQFFHEMRLLTLIENVLVSNDATTIPVLLATDIASNKAPKAASVQRIAIFPRQPLKWRPKSKDANNSHEMTEKTVL